MDFNINTTQDQSLIAGGLNPNDPSENFGDMIAKNQMKQAEQRQLVMQAVERSKQAKLSTKQKTEADAAGVNPELSEYLPKEQAIAFIKQAWEVGDDDPKVAELHRVLPNQVNRYTVQTIMRKRDMSLGKSIGEPFKATEGQVYPSHIKGTGEPAMLQKDQTYQAYVGEDGSISYVPSGIKPNFNSNTFKPVGQTSTGDAVSPTRTGQLVVTGKDGNVRPYDPGVDGEIQPFVNPTIASGDLGDIQRMQASLETLYKVKGLFSPTAVGPIQDRLMNLSTTTGVDFSKLFGNSSAYQADNVEFRIALQTAINDYIKAVTGAQMSEAEASRLQRAMPQSGNAQEAFLPALVEATEIIENKLNSKLELMEAAGIRNVKAMRDVIKHRTSSAAASATAPKPGAAPAGPVPEYTVEE